MFDKNHLLTYAAVAAMALLIHPNSPIAGESLCSFQAMGNDPDPSGTNVRSGPGTQYDVIARLPQFDEVDGEAFRPEFEVRGFDKGWFEIADVTLGQYGPDEARKVFQGPGWISAKLASVWVEGLALHVAPDMSSAESFSLSGDGFSPEEGVVTAFHGCRGGFVDISVQRPDGVTGRGWTDDICANQVTTCS